MSAISKWGTAVLVAVCGSRSEAQSGPMKQIDLAWKNRQSAVGSADFRYEMTVWIKKGSSSPFGDTQEPSDDVTHKHDCRLLFSGSMIRFDGDIRPITREEALRAMMEQIVDLDRSSRSDGPCALLQSVPNGSGRNPLPSAFVSGLPPFSFKKNFANAGMQSRRMLRQYERIAR